jgi:arylsulfatase A-like enzyme
MSRTPNVVLVLSDQHRGMDTGVAGNPDVRTPNVDRLAAEGTRFRRAFANVPVCTPSRASLLTGRYPQTNDVIANDLALPAGAWTLGEAFAGAGYRTGYVGKWHLDGVPRDRYTPPERRHGFDFWAAYNCSHQYFDAPYYRNDDELRRHEWGPAGETELAVEFVERAASADEPFFLVVSYGPPHAPYDEVPERYRTDDPDALTPRANAEPIPGAEHDPRGLLADYYAQVTAVDDQFGRILDALDDSGLAAETVVAYTADHGDMLCSHGRRKKEQPEAESIRVPLVVRYPGEVAAGAEREELASLVDVAPTLCSLAGVDPGNGTDGTDLAPALRGKPLDGPDSVFLSVLVSADQAEAQGIPEWRGVRTRRYTYARLADGTGWVLYDDEEGPWQLRNRILDARDVRERLDGLLDEWLDALDDPFLDGPDQLARHGRLEEWHERERTLPFRESPGAVEE